jgi:hypothetical protein
MSSSSWPLAGDQKSIGTIYVNVSFLYSLHPCPRGHFFMSGDVFGCPKWVWESQASRGRVDDEKASLDRIRHYL